MLINLTIDNLNEIQKKYLIKDMEEFAELIQAISKFLINKNNHHNLLEEIADCECAISHLKSLFHILDSEIEEIQIKKGVYKKYD